jgi:hypothetical protein
MGAEPQQTRPFSYTILQVVPCIERDERLNAGVALLCRQHDFLDIRIGLGQRRLAALAPGTDYSAICDRLDDVRRIIEGGSGSGVLGGMPASERFGWLAAPSSTVIQSSSVHTGMTADPAAELERLFQALVS